MNAPIEIPSGRIYYDDAIDAEDFGIYANLDALMLGVIADPSHLSKYATVIRFEEDENSLWVVYETCTNLRHGCDCTPLAVNRTAERVNEYIDKQGIYRTAIEGEEHLDGRTEKMPLLTDDEFDNMDNDPKDCEQFEKVEYKRIEIGVIVK
jgi:hypothetical protein